MSTSPGKGPDLPASWTKFSTPDTEVIDPDESLHGVAAITLNRGVAVGSYTPVGSTALPLGHGLGRQAVYVRWPVRGPALSAAASKTRGRQVARLIDRLKAR